MLYMNVCTYATWEPVTCRGPKRESDPLVLKLKQAFVSNPIQPSTEPGFSSRAVFLTDEPSLLFQIFIILF